jgi:hypothetical protein
MYVMEPTPPTPPAQAGPPPDPEDWTDEQWLEWLEVIDDPGEDRTITRTRDHPRHRGGALGAAMLGLHDAIYGHPDKAAAVVNASGDPPNDDKPEVHLDPEHPERSEVIVRRRSDQPHARRDV